MTPAHDMSPRKFSAWLELAIADLKRVELDPVFEVDMTCFLKQHYTRPGVCRVCLAGSVLAGAGHNPTSRFADEFHSLTQFERNLLQAIDAVRGGHIQTSLIYAQDAVGYIPEADRKKMSPLGFSGWPVSLPDAVEWVYSRNDSNAEFFAYIQAVADKLKEVEL
jgi:hypothetical protein